MLRGLTKRLEIEPMYEVALDMLARPAPCDLVPRTNFF